MIRYRWSVFHRCPWRHTHTHTQLCEECGGAAAAASPQDVTCPAEIKGEKILSRRNKVPGIYYNILEYCRAILACGNAWEFHMCVGVRKHLGMWIMSHMSRERRVSCISVFHSHSGQIRKGEPLEKHLGRASSESWNIILFSFSLSVFGLFQRVLQ